ncbi:MAG: thioredoxin-disulfide reductase [Micrococcales bacterium]|nr:thioredoxin-disulfide reductase [Micrococcales bacterium]
MSIVIVGSGPAGYTAAIYAARAGLEPVVIASSVEIGGPLTTTTEIENYPGFPDGIYGPELMERMRAQVERLGAVIVPDDAIRVATAGDIKEVETSDGTVHRARALILATGSAYRTLGLECEKQLVGRGVSYCATCDGAFYRGRPIVVVGGGDSAVGEATFLARFASSVVIIHRRDQLRAAHRVAARAFEEPKISFAWNSVVTDILGAERVAGVELTDTLTGARRELAADGVFVAIGHTPRSELVQGQLNLDPEGHILVEPGRSHTSVPGVFACGDVVDAIYRQAITAAGSGARAALDALGYLESE